MQERPDKPTPCFRCRAYGHKAAECTQEDRRDNCRRCGQPGHLEQGCEADPHCMACHSLGVPSGHFTGSKACSAFRAASIPTGKNGKETPREA